MKLRKFFLPLLILAASILFVATSSEATLVFSADDFTATSGGDTVTIQVRVWGPAYTGAEVAAGTIPNAAGATVGSTFYTYAYRLTNSGASANPISAFRINIVAPALGAGSTTNDSGAGTAPTAQSYPSTSGSGWFLNTFGTTISPGGSSRWMWLTSNFEPSLPSGFSSTNNSVGGRTSQTSWEFAGTGSTNLPAPNPEPATSLLFSTGLGGLAFWRRRKLGSWLKNRLRREPPSLSPEDADQT